MTSIPSLNSFLCRIVLVTILALAGCSVDNEDEYTDPFPFPESVEDNTGSRPRSLTYVYDRSVVDHTYPLKIDSSIILFSYDSFGKIKRIRLNHGGFFIYDFSFERNNNHLSAIHCKSWPLTTNPNPTITQSNLDLEYNPSGTVTLMKAYTLDGPIREVDSLFIKSTGSRIDSVINPFYSLGSNADKYAYTYNTAGDITQIDDIFSSGASWAYEKIYKYTLSPNPAAITLGNEAIPWEFLAKYVNVSSITDFIIPPILFHSTKQPSKLVLQVSGFYTGTYNYQTEYYGTGLPKKMTANVTTLTGDLYARETYYYSYTR